MLGVILNNLILFDFDGVLCDSLSLVIDISNSVSLELGGTGGLNSEKIARLENVTFPEIAQLVGVTNEQFAEFSKRLFQNFSKRSAEVELFPGVSEQVKHLSKHNTLGVITANHSDVVEEILERAGILDCFTKILGANHQGSKERKIMDFAIGHNKNYRNLWMVGDSKSDIAAGHLAQARTVAVTWGWQTESSLKGMNPTLIAQSPEELSPILAS